MSSITDFGSVISFKSSPAFSNFLPCVSNRPATVVGGFFVPCFSINCSNPFPFISSPLPNFTTSAFCIGGSLKFKSLLTLAV
jgi:hypothetical protein